MFSLIIHDTQFVAPFLVWLFHLPQSTSQPFFWLPWWFTNWKFGHKFQSENLAPLVNCEELLWYSSNEKQSGCICVLAMSWLWKGGKNKKGRKKEDVEKAVCLIWLPTHTGQYCLEGTFNRRRKPHISAKTAFPSSPSDLFFTEEKLEWRCQNLFLHCFLVVKQILLFASLFNFPN